MQLVLESHISQRALHLPHVPERLATNSVPTRAPSSRLISSAYDRAIAMRFAFRIIYSWRSDFCVRSFVRAFRLAAQPSTRSKQFAKADVCNGVWSSSEMRSCARGIPLTGKSQTMTKQRELALFAASLLSGK